MTTKAAMSRAEILALPPTHSLETLGRALGVSGPTIRAQHRNGHLEVLGIKIVSLGAQYRVITATLWDFLGVYPDQPIAPALSNGYRSPQVDAAPPDR